MTIEESSKAKIYQWLKLRDNLAGLLAESMNIRKFPNLANEYYKRFGEKHFSHNWHTS